MFPSDLIRAFLACTVLVTAHPVSETVDHPPTKIVNRDDLPCQPTYVDVSSGPYFGCYVENSATDVIGAVQTVSPKINCDTNAGCSSAVSSTYTSSQSFSFDIGIDGGASKGAFMSGVSAGASWEWSMSEATSTTQTFNLSDGEQGYIYFWPYEHQSCGGLVIANAVCDTACTMGDVVLNDPNACGTTPILRDVSNGSRALQGVAQFCHTDTQEGCSNPPGP